MTQPPSSAKPPQQSRASLRKTLLNQRRQTEALVRQQWDQQITDRVINWCQQERPASLGVFWPIRAEPDLRQCYQQLQDMGIQLALPIVIAQHQPLVFVRWQPGDLMGTDEHGIPVPAQRDLVMRPQALLIPCVGFNSARYRLGYGGGYYDRTLADSPRPMTIGIAYHQGLSEFTAEAHDVAMAYIFTECAA